MMNERKNKRMEKMRDVMDGSCQNQRVVNASFISPRSLYIGHDWIWTLSFLSLKSFMD